MTITNKPIHQRVVKARMALVLTQPFFGTLALRLRIVEMPGQGSACTDGKIFGYDPAYVDKLSDAELRGLWCHEVLHCSLGHVWRKQHREHHRWNVACDYAVDPIVVATRDTAGKTMVVPDATIDPAYTGKPAEGIYDLLPKGDGSGGGSSGNGSGSSNGKPTPTKGEVLPAPRESAVEDEAQWKMATIQAANVAKQKGMLPAGMEALVEQLKQSSVDWRSYLRRFVQQVASLDYTWRAPSPRYLASGLYLPRLRSETMPPIVVVFDTSGSCWGVQDKFFGELRALLDDARPQKVHFLQCDGAIQSAEELEPGDPIRPSAHGGGGTSFVPPFDWVETHEVEPACMIYLTDCYGDYPAVEPGYPVLWASVTRDPGGSYTPPFGEFLFVGES